MIGFQNLAKLNNEKFDAHIKDLEDFLESGICRPPCISAADFLNLRN